MQFLVEAAGLWHSITSAVGLPGFVTTLAKFLKFHAALLLVPVVPLCLHPSCNLLVDVHISVAGHTGNLNPYQLNRKFLRDYRIVFFFTTFTVKF